MDALKEMSRSGLILCLVVVACGSMLIATGSPPGIGVQRVPTNAAMLSITITNAATNSAAYDLWRRRLFNEAYPWTLHVTGAVNQTTFLVEKGIQTIGFFAATTNDLDGDGVLNIEDGGLTDTNIGALRTVIVFPADGATIE